MQGGQSRLAGSQHNDVLGIDPVDNVERQKLVDEIKRRGNAAFKVGSLREADLLYSRCIELCKDSVIKQSLYSNRSMTYSKLGLFDKAEDDAKEFLKLEPASAKAYYRLAVAERGLNNYGKSLESFNESLRIEPGNKNVLREIEKTKKAFETYKVQEEKRKTEALEASKVKNIQISKRIVDPSKEKKSPTRQTTTKPETDLSMRGYRTLGDGRKTTYFNMVRTEEELKLIGENKPQKLGNDEPDATPDETQIMQGASAWNQKGTFEEKDFTDWARSRMEELIVRNCTLKDDVAVQGEAFVLSFSCEDKFKGFEGNASKTFTRKKFRRIFDFNFKIGFKVIVLDDAGNTLKEAKMDMFVTDFNGDIVANNEVIEIELCWDNRNSSGKFMNSIKHSLIEDGIISEKIRDSLLQWHSEFEQL